MTKSRSCLTELPVLLADAASLHMLFLLFSFAQDVPVAGQTGILVWWVCLTAAYFALARFLRRPRSLRWMAVFSAEGILIQTALSLLLGVRYPTAFGWICILILWGGMYAQCCNVLLHSFTNEQLIGAFERTAAVVLVSALAVSAGVITADVLFPPVIGLLLTLLALSRSRSDRTRTPAQGDNRMPNRLLLVLAVLLLGGGAAACAVLFTDLAAVLLTDLTNWLKTVGWNLLNALGRFLYWLFSLLPEPQSQMAEPYPEGYAQEIPAGDVSVQSDRMLYLLLGIIVVLLAVFVFWFLRRGGTAHLPALSRRAGSTYRSRKRWKDILAQLWGRITAFFCFQYAYLTKRNTAPGLLVWLERKLRLRRAGRKTNETAREFLTRVGELFPQCREELERLAEYLDAYYFGSGQTLSHGEISALRRRLKKALRERGSEGRAAANQYFLTS